MMQRILQLETQPEFYNTLGSSCMTNIAYHVNEIAPETIAWSYKTVFPGYSDEVALMGTQVLLDELRSQYLVNAMAKDYGDGGAVFSDDTEWYSGR